MLHWRRFTPFRAEIDLAAMISIQPSERFNGLHAQIPFRRFSKNSHFGVEFDDSHLKVMVYPSQFESGFCVDHGLHRSLVLNSQIKLFSPFLFNFTAGIFCLSLFSDYCLHDSSFVCCTKCL